MAAELPRPGVEVIQVFRSVTPTVVSPTLVPCIVGVCRQIVDVLVPAASGSGSQLNTEALIALPGFFEAAVAPGSPPAYTTLDGEDLILSITGGPDVTVTFSGTSLSPASVVAQIKAAFLAAGVTEATAEESADGTFFMVRTVGTGEFENIEIKTGTTAAVLAAFDLIIGYVFTGKSSYSQYVEVIPTLAFPDPRSNLSELALEPESVRVFFGLGSGTNLREASKTSALMRVGGEGGPAEIVSTVDITGLTYPLAATTMDVELDGAAAITVTLTGAVGPADLIQKINAGVGQLIAFKSTNYIRFTTRTLGADASITLSGAGCTTLFGSTPKSATGTAGVLILDDGNGDSVSPLVDFYREDFTAAETPAVVNGYVDLTTLTYPGDVAGETLILSVDGEPDQTLTFTTPMASAAAILTQINAFWPGLTATLDGNNHLVLTTTKTGLDASIKVVGGTLMGTFGLSPVLDGVVDVSTILPNLTALNGKKVKFYLDGTYVEHTFAGLAGPDVIADLVAEINGDAAFAALATASVLPGGTNQVRIILNNPTPTSVLRCFPASSSEGAYMLGFDTATPISHPQTLLGTKFGGKFAPISGDELYVDGTYIGKITAVAPGGDVSVLRVNKQIAINSNYGTYWYLVAKNLTGAGVSGRPDPELVVDSGTAVPTIKPFILRDTVGKPTSSSVSVYLAYHAIRKDVTMRAENPGLLQLSSTDDLANVLEPVNTLNPLALGLYFALLNAPGAKVSGMGVDEISAQAPYGTVEAFTRAAEALEQYEVYAVTPLTHDETVAQVYNTHVSSMSEPASKGERICLFNLSKPSKKVDTLVASGLEGNSVGGTGLVFDTGVPNLAALVLAQGVNPVGTIPVSAGLFLTIASSSLYYSIESISGSVVTVRTTFSAGENDDGFYSTTALNVSPLPSTLIDEIFSVKVRGGDLVLAGTTIPDKEGIAETYQKLAQGYANRRFWNIIPDQVAATLGGVEQIIEGFYACAAIAGMIAQQPPQQSFTNFPMTGFTRVIGSNDFFTNRQLDVIAAGGNYILVQDEAGAPIISRMALTTDVTSLETRTDSITKIVDFTAKFMRRGLRSYIGRFNITQGFLDSLGHVVQGLLGFLVDIGVLIGANLNNVVQDESAPDTVLIDVTLDVPFPCNYIRLTLVI